MAGTIPRSALTGRDGGEAPASTAPLAREAATRVRHALFGWVERRALVVIRCVARAIIRTAPPSQAYAVAYRLTALSYPVVSLPYRLLAPRQRQKDWRPMILREALAVMTRIRPGFPVRVRLEGGEILDALYQETPRVILCTVHFGLTLAAPRALADRGYRVALIAAPAGGNDSGWNWGLTERLTVLYDGADVLLRARTAIAGGTAIICYADYAVERRPDGSARMALSPNVFRFAERFGASLLFLHSRLERDGTIAIEIQAPRHHTPRTAGDADRCFAEFMAFAQARTGQAYEVRRPRKRPV